MSQSINLCRLKGLRDGGGEGRIGEEPAECELAMDKKRKVVVLLVVVLFL